MDERYQSATEVSSDLLAIRGNRGLKVQQKKKTVEKGKFSTPNLVPILLVVCMVLSAFLVLILMSGSSLQRVSPPVSVVTSATAEKLPVTDRRYFERVPISQCTSKPWTLLFPPPEVGRVALSTLPEAPTKPADLRLAQGPVTFPRAGPLAFMTDMGDDFKGEDFLRFRSDEIRELILVGIEITDSVLERIGSYTSLKSLDLDACDSLSDKCVPFIARIHSLNSLSITGLSISSLQIARLAKALKLQTLTVKKSYNVDHLARELVGADSLRFLFLEDDRKLSNEGLTEIGKLKDLKMLSLVGCPDITDEGVSRLTGLRNLTEIALQNTKVTPKSMATLKKFPRGCVVAVDYTKWPPADAQLFVHDFKNFQVP